MLRWLLLSQWRVVSLMVTASHPVSSSGREDASTDRVAIVPIKFMFSPLGSCPEAMEMAPVASGSRSGGRRP